MRTALVMSSLSFLLIAAGLPAAADVYRWTDDKGVIHYTDTPPAKDAKPAELPKLQTYSPVAPAARVSGAASAGDPAAVSKPEVTITSPAQGETIRDPEGKVSIAVSAALQPGQGLVYSVDGRIQNPEPTPSTGYLVSGLERGEHRLGAVIMAADGQELARAAPVTVYLMPSVIRKH